MILECLGLLIVIIFIPRLLPTQHWLRFYAGYTQLTVIGSLVTVSLLPLRLVSVRAYSKILYGTALFLFMILGVKWEIRNRNHFEKNKGMILAVNHQSVLDGLGITILNHGCENITGVAKREMLYFPPVALLFWTLGIVFIDRKNSKKAMDQMKSEFSKIKDTKVVIFPEGTRNKKGDGLLQFKRGAFRLAVELKLPVVPVVISPYTFIKGGEKFSDGKQIVTCLEPIETDDLTLDDVDNLMERTRKLMEAEYFKMSAELKSLQH